MIDRQHRLETEETCKRLREVLLQTRGLGRRDFIKALGGAFAGAALPGLHPAGAAELPVTALVFGGVWKKAAMKAQAPATMPKPATKFFTKAENSEAT